MERSNTVRQLAELAMEADMLEGLAWDNMPMSKQEAFEKMASEVLNQLENVSENERAVVAMATMTKLLVENLILKTMIQESNQ
jgi:hypothetical protein